MKNTVAVICVALFSALSSTAAMAAREYETPSGRPEAVFVNTTAEDASNKIATFCAKQGWTPSRQSMQVTCEFKINGFAQALTNALTAPRYATSVRHFISFNLIQDGRQTLSQARQYQSFTTAFGQYNETEIANDDAFNGSIGVMVAAGAVLPIGTRFRNKPWWGIGFSPSANDKSPLKIEYFYDKSPAENAGLKPSDEIVAINGKKCKNIKQCFKISDSINIGNNITVSVIRDNKLYEFSWIATKRPDVTELEGCNDICLGSFEEPETNSLESPSLVTEMERLNSLKEKGILTEQEFQAAKRKILGIN
jgi:hypothetical protein